MWRARTRGYAAAAAAAAAAGGVFALADTTTTPPLRRHHHHHPTRNPTPVAFEEGGDAGTRTRSPGTAVRVTAG